MAVLRSMIDEMRSDNPKRGAQFKINKYNGNKEIIRRLRIQNKKLLVQLNLVKVKFKQLKTERIHLLTDLKQVSRYNKSLADALGSCAMCWGEDRNCIYCYGKGSAGWRAKNRILFNRYVHPGLGSIQLKQNRKA